MILRFSPETHDIYKNCLKKEKLLFYKEDWHLIIL